MGVAKDFVTATFADALAPTLRRPVEDIIYETLDKRQVPTRTDFKELRDLLNLLRGQVTGATQGAKKMAENLEEIDSIIDQFETTSNQQSAEIDKLKTTVSDYENKIQAMMARLTLLEKAQADNESIIKGYIEQYLTQNPNAEQRNSLFCKVDGCNEKSRAKGFCAKHYQKWRRGTLSGYVNHEGLILHQGKSFEIGDKYAGEPFSIHPDGIEFNGNVFTLS